MKRFAIELIVIGIINHIHWIAIHALYKQEIIWDMEWTVRYGIDFAIFYACWAAIKRTLKS